MMIDSYFEAFQRTLLSCCFVKLIIGAAFLGVGIKVAIRVYKTKQTRLRHEHSLKHKDVVILHQFPRGVNVPNISPFPLKVESYLKLANITYKNDHRDYMSPKGKCPYITLNGVDISDSQFIVEHLNETFKVDLDEGLSAEDKAVGRALRILAEEHLYWCLVLHRWIYDKEHSIMKLSRWPPYFKPFIRFVISHRCKKAAYMQGLGRHTKEEVTKVTMQNIKALSTFLGDKPFFFGDRPTESDCGIFGILAQFNWTLPGTVFDEIMSGECKNLREYCLRMKEKVWPDWDKHIRPNKQ